MIDFSVTPADAMLERHSRDQERRRVLGAFNEPTLERLYFGYVRFA